MTASIDGIARPQEREAPQPLSLLIGPAVARALRLSALGGPLAQSAIALDDLIELTEPDDREALATMIRWARTSGDRRARLLFRVRRPDGEHVGVVGTIGGTAAGSVELSLDLDDAAAARRAEAHIRQIVEGANQAAVVHVGKQVVYSNPALAKLMGYASLEEMRSQGVGADHTHPDDRAMVYGRMAKRLAGERAPEHYEFRAVRTDGTVIWVECFASHVTWNGQSASLAWLLDITERKRMQEALQRSETLFAAMFEASPVMLALMRLDDWRFVELNPTFAKVAGLERDTIVGRTEREIGLFADSHAIHGIVDGLDNQRRAEIVTTMATAAGGQRSIALSGEKVHFVDMDLLLIVGRDVTDRRREEAELRKSKIEAELANRAKSEFLANMSHELRTPLNAIIGFSEIIKDEVFGPIGMPRYVDYSRDIWSSGNHLLQIINDLLDLSKVEAGKQELHESPISVPQLIGDSLNLVRERAAAAGLSLAVEVEAGLPAVWGDHRLMKQILLNLLTNAIKFTPRAGRIAVTALTRSGELEIAVADTGIGMSEAELEIAQKPFGQIASALARQHQGTGLGLPLVRSLVQLHGGRLILESAPGVGTKVRVILPPGRLLRD
jgi:two-component system cell cycle sensor histidine kinase PleC